MSMMILPALRIACLAACNLRRKSAVAVVAVLVGSPCLGDGKKSEVEGILERLASNVTRIETVEFVLTHDVLYRSRVRVLEKAFREVRRVHYEPEIDEILVEIFEPIHRSEDYGDEGEARHPATKAGFTGYPLWIFRPDLQVWGWETSLAPTAPSGHVVVKGRPAVNRSVVGFPHWEALVDLARNRLLSVTCYADSGEIERTLGFEAYMEFGVGAVLPLRIRAVEYARLNMLVGTDTFEQVSVGIEGAKKRHR
jgi:hypothetical protein